MYYSKIYFFNINEIENDRNYILFVMSRIYKNQMLMSEEKKTIYQSYFNKLQLVVHYTAISILAWTDGYQYIHGTGLGFWFTAH